jgi:hypothetical protein
VCGRFEISGSALKVLPNLKGKYPGASALISYHIRKLQRDEGEPFIDDNTLNRILSETTLPSPAEQAANLIRWLGDQLRNINPAGRVGLDLKATAALVGASNEDGVRYVLQELEERGIIHAISATGIADVGLTFNGWEVYDDLQRAHAEGPIAFMAMPFGDPEMDRMFFECFKPAAEKTGFELRRIDEKPPAGLIDDHLRVEIRRSRFLIADLTNENRGAYWEAGFAEGLGKPVIYTCKRAYFEEKGTHFDTSHHHTVLWDSANMPGAQEQLKATIRATLPEEARLADD